MAKRIHARAMVHRRVEYQHTRGQGEGMLVDLSLQGCRIKGVPPSPCGTRLRLQLWLPDQAQPVNVELAAVRWIAAEQFGVSFQEVSPDARELIEQMVQLLREAQQPQVKVIHIPGFLGSEDGFRHKNPPAHIPETALPEPYLLTETENKIIDDILELVNKHGLMVFDQKLRIQ